MKCTTFIEHVTEWYSTAGWRTRRLEEAKKKGYTITSVGWSKHLGFYFEATKPASAMDLL